jgi:hypothetical protein
MKIITFFLCLALLPEKAQAQIKFELDYGFGQYAMEDLKSFNQGILETLPVKAQITDNFPATSYWKMGILPCSYKFLSFGLTGLYNSTGSRIDHIDFSGEYKLDQVLSSYGFGLIVRIALTKGNFILSENNDLIYTFTRCEMTETILNSQQKYSFRSQSFQFEPGFRLAYEIKPFQLALKLGYTIDFKGYLSLKDDKDSLLTIPQSEEKVQTNWSGLRAGISLCFLL